MINRKCLGDSGGPLLATKYFEVTLRKVYHGISHLAHTLFISMLTADHVKLSGLLVGVRFLPSDFVRKLMISSARCRVQDVGPISFLQHQLLIRS